MADMLADGGLGGQFPLEQWFFEMPVCTRIWTTVTVVISILVQCQLLGPLHLFYSVKSVFIKNQFWRLLTTFCYFGPLSLDLLLHVFFMQRYSRLLEESAGRSPAHYTWLLFYASAILLTIAPTLSMPFLGHALSSVLVYIWSRRNPETRLSFLGLVVFKAPFLPWVLIGFSLLMHGIVPKDEICGIVVGHIYYYFNDLYPPMHGGSRPLDPPGWWMRIFERRQQIEEPSEPEDVRIAGRDLAAGPDVAPAPEVR